MIEPNLPFITPFRKVEKAVLVITVITFREVKNKKGEGRGNVKTGS